MADTRKEKSKRLLEQLAQKPSECIIIHYARQNLYDNEAGRATPRIIAIMLKSLDGRWNHCFAIHYEAEKAKIILEEIENYYDLLEGKLLSGFVSFVKKNKNSNWLHWDMSEVHFSFEAIKHRYDVLNDGDMSGYEEIPYANRVNLNTILKDLYGNNYENEPYFEGLMKTNKGSILNGYLDEAGEAKAFKELKFPQILESLKTKTNFLIEIISLYSSDKLRVSKYYFTNKLKAFITHPVVATISLFISILGIIFKIISLRG